MKKKLAVLTDESFRKSSSASSPPAQPAGETQPSPRSTGQSGPIAVTAWKRVSLPGGDGIAIEGTLHNTTDHIIINACGRGAALRRRRRPSWEPPPGVLSSRSIQPRATIDFRASFPGIFAFGEVRVETQGLPLDVTPADAKPE